MLIKTDAMRLQETVALSQEVKRFEKTFGIKPSTCLRKSASENPPYCVFRVWIQKRGAIALNAPMDITFSLQFPLTEHDGPIALKDFWYDGGEYSACCHRLDAIAFDDYPITPNFAKKHRVNKVEIIIHEDLHFNDNTTSQQNEEAFVMPLGFLAALEFFKAKNDARAVRLIQRKINRYRQLSRDVIVFAAKLTQLLKTSRHNAYRRAKNYMPALYKNYVRKLEKMGKRKRYADSLEAEVSVDLLYLKCFDDVITLSEKVCDFKTLLKIIETAPDDYAAIQRYFKKVAKKYQSPAP